MRARRSWLGWLLVPAIVSSGCSKFDMQRNIPWGAGKDGEFSSAMRVVAMWQDTILHQEGKPSIRGFGGRVFFYSGNGEKPIKTSGTLEVYAFVEDGREAIDTKPDRKYVFTPDQFKEHYSPKKPLGHSYSFWLPWDETGGPQLQITLVARFTPIAGGETVVSEQTHHALPGRDAPLAEKVKYRHKSPSRNLQIADREPEANLVDYQEPLQPYPGSGLDMPPGTIHTRMKTTTIDLPSRFNSGNQSRTAPSATEGANLPPPHSGAAHSNQAAASGVQLAGGMAPGGYSTTVTHGATNQAMVNSHPTLGQFRSRANPSFPGQAQPSYRGAATSLSETREGERTAGLIPVVNNLTEPGAMPGPPPVGYRPAQSRALGAPIVPLERAHGPWLPHHVKWQHGLEPAPQRTLVAGPASRGPDG